MVRLQQQNHQQQPRTLYGTSSLESDESLSGSVAADRRRRLVKWGTTALVVGAGAALLALSSSSSAPTSASTAATPATVTVSADVAAVAAASASETIKCWQSSYINGEKKMMEPITGLQWTKSSSSAASASHIAFDSTQQFQEMLGFGGAFTEAAALQFAKLPAAKQEKVLSLYFDKHNGSAYEFGRVPMGSSDFSPASYNFDNVSGDHALKHFDDNVTHDTHVLIPFIQRALKKNPQLKMFLAPWSPPAWMKRAADDYVPSMLGSALPVGLRNDAQSAWALYFSKFISAYKAHGINFWGLTPQNEPEFAAPWEACGYNASYQAAFVAQHLGPVMRRDHPNVKIMVFDHNRASVRQWAETIFRDPEARKYVDGIAFHWYDNERYMDGVEFHERLNDTHFIDPSRFMLATESCNCPGVAHGADAWFRGQRYAHDIITDFNNWVVGWVDWNLLLDHTGGPNHLGNNCDAPVIVDESEQDFFLQPMYYFIQHFSKFVPPGSRRVHTEVAATFAHPGDAQLFVRYPAALHACDRSARQAIHVTEDSKLQITGTPYCLDLIRPQWIGRQIELVECQYTTQTWTFDHGRIRMDDHCVALSHGSTHNGARVSVERCIEGDATPLHQLWHFANGTMHSRASPTKCITAGYSFVQAVGFVTPANTNVLVVLNENTEDAAFELRVGSGAVLKTSIPQGAIRTYTWE